MKLDGFYIAQDTFSMNYISFTIHFLSIQIIVSLSLFILNN